MARIVVNSSTLYGFEQPYPGSAGKRSCWTPRANSARRLLGRFSAIPSLDASFRLEAMWTMVLETTANLDVQLFATTHSDDCLRGLAAALASHPEHHGAIALHRLDRAREETVHYDAAQIIQSAEAGIEVRG